MGNFNCVMLVLMIGSSLGKASTSLSFVPFCTSHMEDPWTLPSLSTSGEDSIFVETNMLLPITLVDYQAIIGLVVDSSPYSSQAKEEDPYTLRSLVVESSHSHDCLDDIFPTDEAILKAMSGLEKPWVELHHRAYFLPKLYCVECDDNRTILTEKVGRLVVPLGSLGMYAKGKMANLSPTIPITIYCILGKIENV